MSKTKVICNPLYLNCREHRNQQTITFVDGDKRETLTLSQLIHFYLENRKSKQQ